MALHETAFSALKSGRKFRTCLAAYGRPEPEQNIPTAGRFRLCGNFCKPVLGLMSPIQAYVSEK